MRIYDATYAVTSTETPPSGFKAGKAILAKGASASGSWSIEANTSCEAMSRVLQKLDTGYYADNIVLTVTIRPRPAP